MKRSDLKSQVDDLNHQATSPDCLEAVGIVGENETEYSFDFNEADRADLIQELRCVLSDLAKAEDDFIEFSLNDIGFCIELNEDEANGD